MIPYLRAANVKDGRLLLDDVLTMNFTPSEQLTYTLQRGDVLVSEGCGSARELGASAQWNSELEGVVGMQNTLLRLRSVNGRSDPDFLLALARWLQHSGAWLEASSGISILHIGLNRAKRVVVKVPELPAQQRIGQVLRSLSDLIANNRRRVELLEQMAEAIYREWFVHFRYPGHEGVAMVDSPLGPIPEGWETHQLCGFVSTQYGYTETATDQPIGPRFLRGKDINKKSYIDWSSVPYCRATASDAAKFQIQLGDIFVIRMADPGKVGMCEVPLDAVFASYLVRLRPIDHRITPYFLFFTLRGDAYQGWITGASSGATRQSVSAKVMTDPLFMLPDTNLQELFGARVTPIRQMISRLNEQIAELTNLSDLLLPKLVTGQIDVSNLDLGPLVEAPI